MPIPEPVELPTSLQLRLERWLQRWGTRDLAQSLRVEFSPRLTRAFGRCYQAERLIRLTPSLATSQSHLLTEILCHEAAHAAVYEKHGAEARPHGREWENMMRAAGFEPRVRIPVVVRRVRRTAKVVYLHHCPVCDQARPATKPMRQWRCRNCSDTRSEGRLVIRRELPDLQPRRQAAASGKKRRRSRTVAGTGRRSTKKS